MQKDKTLILVADVAQARLFAVNKLKFMREPNKDNFELVSELSHDKSRDANRELVTDRAGRFNSGSFEQRTDPKEHEADVFSHEILKQLEAHRQHPSFKELVIVASSAFMGLLNRNMSKELDRLVSLRIEKDYSHLNGNELMQALVNHF